MKHTPKILAILTAFWLAGGPAKASIHLDLDVENVHVATVGSLAPSNSTVVLLASTTDSSFGDLSFSDNPALADSQFTAEPDDVVLGMWALGAGSGADGVFQNAVDFDPSLVPNLNQGDPLLLVWYPDLPYNPARLGPGQGQRYGTYRSDAATQGSQIGWLVPADGFGGNLFTFTVDAGGDVPDSSLVAGQTSQETPLAKWQTQYFGCYTCPQAQPNADPCGKGISNTNQFLMGLNPTNTASTFKITSVTSSNISMIVTWKTSGGDASGLFGQGRTNVLEFTSGTPNGSFLNNFTSTGLTNVISTLGDVITSATDVGGATNKAARYYRVRFLPPP